MGGTVFPAAVDQYGRVCVSHHAIHSEMVVLGLQLNGVGVVVANFCVACQEQTLVVHDPVKHLRGKE